MKNWTDMVIIMAKYMHTFYSVCTLNCILLESDHELLLANEVARSATE